VRVVNQLALQVKSKSTALKTSSSYIYSLLIWAGCTLAYLSNVRRSWWIYRDDSVIHLSAAKNLSIFGSIGLSAGDRVESLSSPLNFFISLVVYLLNPELEYKTYLNYFLVISLCLLAIAINFALLEGLLSGNKTYIKVIVFNSIACIVTISSWTTFGWLISGMENILLVILFCMLIGATVGDRTYFWVALASISLLGVTRVELAALLLPLLFVIVVGLEDTKKRKRFFLFFPLGFWATVHLTRYLYFGHLLPNTATALGKNLPIYLAGFLLVEFGLILITLFGFSKIFSRKRKTVVPILIMLLCIGIWRVSNSSLVNMYQTVSLVCLAGIIFLLSFLVFKENLDLQSKILIVLLTIPLNHFFLFGPARLSAFRIVSAFVIPIILVTLLTISKQLKNLSSNTLMLLFLFSTAVTCAVVVSKIDYQRNLCCSISPSDQYINAQAQRVFSNTSGQAPLPIVANPDLGKISFPKNLMNVDLGLIGEPVLAKISRKSPSFVDEYITNYIAPDIIELHGHWNCVYSKLLNDERFKKEWSIAWSGFVSGEMNVASTSDCPRSGAYTIWEREIPEKERLISNTIANTPYSIYSELIKSEVSSCSISSSGCQYLARAIIRNKPKLLERGDLTKTVMLLANSQSYEFDYSRILQPRKWDENAYRWIIKLIKSEH
jgi:hypothetical protein